MIRAKYQCPVCKKEEVIKFKTGTIPEAPRCNNCEKEMIRQYGTINIGEVTSDEMIHLGQKMLYN